MLSPDLTPNTPFQQEGAEHNHCENLPGCTSQNVDFQRVGPEQPTKSLSQLSVIITNLSLGTDQSNLLQKGRKDKFLVVVPEEKSFKDVS